MAAPSETPSLGNDFFEAVEKMHSTDEKIRWYMCVIVNLASLNFPELVPTIWDHMALHIFPSMSHNEKFKATQKIRESITKACGIFGAAKAGNAMRLISQSIPKDLRDPVSLRAKEDPAAAAERGHAFWRGIYARNPEFDPNATVEASADYAYVVRDILYARIFSFDGIISNLETGYVIVSALIGIDCQNQLRHHMKGMLYNGATREELEQLRDLCLDIARRLGVVFRHPPRAVPSIDD